MEKGLSVIKYGACYRLLCLQQAFSKLPSVCGTVVECLIIKTVEKTFKTSRIFSLLLVFNCLWLLQWHCTSQRVGRPGVAPGRTWDGMVSVGGTCTLGILAEGPPVGGRPARLSFWTCSLPHPVSGLVSTYCSACVSCYLLLTMIINTSHGTVHGGCRGRACV